MIPKIKFCGITRKEDAELAIKLGVDAIGLVFFPESKRYISPIQAASIINNLPPFLTIVGVFVNPTTQEVQEILKHVRLNCLQFHGNETAEFCNSFHMPFIKAFRIGNNDVQLENFAKQYPKANAVLLDTDIAGEWGGSGKTFNWQHVLTDSLTKPWILSGGLTVDNVTDAIRELSPYAVDVSSGIEQAPGIKDEIKMRAFVEAVYG